jgi:hypothetical protein
VKLIASSKKGALIVTPYRVVFASFHRRYDLALIKTDAFGKERNMHTPFVLGPAQCGHPVYHDFALSEGEVPRIKQAASDELRKQPLVSSKGRE